MMEALMTSMISGASPSPDDPDDGVQNGAPTAVGVVHSSPLIRQGLEELLSRQPGIRVIGLFSGAAEILAHPYPDDHVLLYDFSTARQDGVPLLMQLRLRVGQARLLMFDVPDDDRAIIECVRLGATGCLLPDTSLDELLPAMRNLTVGLPPLSQRVVTSLVSYVAGMSSPPHGTPIAGLTAREQQILELLTAGLSNKEIARKLVLQPQTVRNYVHLIFQKLDVHNREEAIRAVRMGRFPPTDALPKPA